MFWYPLRYQAFLKIKKYFFAKKGYTNKSYIVSVALDWFQRRSSALIIVGWIPNLAESSATVSSFRTAARATFALNSGLYWVLFLLIVISFNGLTQSLAHCPIFWDHLNFQRAERRDSDSYLYQWSEKARWRYCLLHASSMGRIGEFFQRDHVSLQFQLSPRLRYKGIRRTANGR